MLYTEKTIKALKLCYDAYLGQYDVSGFPYVFHPFHLAEQMNDEMSIAVTLLHYVLEDTDLTLEELATQDFGDEIITALRVMIRDRSTSYHQYLDEVKKNVCAKKAILNELEYKKELLELKPKLKFDDISRLDSYNDGIRYLKEDNIKKENDVQEQTVPAQPVETEEEQEQVGYDVSERTVPTKKIINYSEELKKNEEKGKSTPRIKLSDPDITKRPRPQEPKEKSKKKEPDKIVYEGKTYLRYSDKWSDSSHVIVPETLQRKLNRMFSETIDFSSMRYEQILAEADRYRDSSSYTLAIKYYEYAITKGGEHNARIIFPRITSCYRRSGQSKKAVELYEVLCRRYGASMISPVLLTSVAAAFCDLGKYEDARQCCDRAFAMTNGNPDPELRLVYQRLKSEGY